MISIECFKGLPVVYESFLIEKYESFITTCRYIEVYYPSYEINYMLVFEKSNLMELLVFGNKGKISICLNSLANIDQMVISECSKKLFEEYPSIQKLKIEASYLNYNFKNYFCINFFLATLPMLSIADIG